MAWTRIMNDRAEQRRLLEADLSQMTWELNYRLLMESGLTGNTLQVDWIIIEDIAQPDVPKMTWGKRLLRKLKRWLACLKSGMS